MRERKREREREREREERERVHSCQKKLKGRGMGICNLFSLLFQFEEIPFQRFLKKKPNVF